MSRLDTLYGVEGSPTNKSVFSDQGSRQNLESRFLTAWEGFMKGGSPPHFKFLKNQSNKLDAWMTPRVVLEDPTLIEDANYVRMKLGYTRMSSLSLGFRDDPELEGKVLAVSLSGLDMKTGKALKKPIILGIWDKETDKVLPLEGRDLQKEWNAQFREYHKDDPEMLALFEELEQIATPEGQTSSLERE